MARHGCWWPLAAGSALAGSSEPCRENTHRHTAPVSGHPAGRQPAAGERLPPPGPLTSSPAPGREETGREQRGGREHPALPPSGSTRERSQPRSCHSRPREGGPGTCHSRALEPPGPPHSPARAPRRPPRSRAGLQRRSRSSGSGGGGRDSPTARSLQLWAGQQLAHPLTAATNALRAPFPHSFPCFSEINFTGSARSAPSRRCRHSSRESHVSALGLRPSPPSAADGASVAARCFGAP